MLKKKNPTIPAELKNLRRGYTQIPTDRYTQRILSDETEGKESHNHNTHCRSVYQIMLC